MSEFKQVIGINEIQAVRIECRKCLSTAEIAVGKIRGLLGSDKFVTCAFCGEVFKGSGGSATLLAKAIDQLGTTGCRLSIVINAEDGRPTAAAVVS
jgi:hypothetical protein